MRILMTSFWVGFIIGCGQKEAEDTAIDTAEVEEVEDSAAEGEEETEEGSEESEEGEE